MSDTEKQLQAFVEKEEAKISEPAKVSFDDATPKPNSSGVGTSKLPFQKTEERMAAGNTIGWQKINMLDLPTQGKFYPESTEIVIRSATAQEIRHWSTLQEDDLSVLDDMLNYVLERCSSFKTKGTHSSWKDIKEIDRFYILLAIREYTFVKGENQLQVKTSETETINVGKEMIDFLTFDPRLMKYYSPEKRCFSLQFKSGKTIDVSIPSVGVTNFLKTYIQRKQQQQLMIDTDFLSFAPFVIKDWRGLSDTSYEQIVSESNSWSIQEISVLTKLKDLFADTVNPEVKYVDEGGTEQTAPLNFLGGIKSIFLISDPFGELV